MAVGLVGNAIYVNQQTASATSLQNAHNNRIEFQNMVAQAAAQEKEKEVLEVRPAEEVHEIDPDREHEKNEADQETARNKKRESSKEEESSTPLHILDIKV
ncbi:hypothetical protein [Sulfurimonas sp.]|jgi:head-tail adaptor|uniref:hypothetical protein n=1 Tax=Sulfurimonas sp. TaxID=2022749 RepID=UPI0025F08888|nr:hypothetical protein [Sulfurimonas sp.]MCK9472869.1 hypothetical protein [Sulfurimonas sp.]MDD3504957.1 hypothetical protein [Sulfurimonas sp.]